MAAAASTTGSSPPSVGCLAFALLASTSYVLAVLVALGAGVALTFAAAVLFERQVDRPQSPHL